MAMIRWCGVKEKPWRLIYAARSRQRAAFFEDLSSGADARRVSLDVAVALADLAANEHVYCCGPASLMQAVKDQTTDCPPGTSVLEVLERSGLVRPYSCREGLCGTCRTTVLAGQPDHRDYVLTDDERKAGTAMMVCVSRARSPDLVLDL